jgi:hypothetical protein
MAPFRHMMVSVLFSPQQCVNSTVCQGTIPSRYAGRWVSIAKYSDARFDLYSIPTLIMLEVLAHLNFTHETPTAL